MRLLQNNDLGKLLLRLCIGILILPHGVSKLMDPTSLNGIAHQLPSMDLPSFIVYGVLVGGVVAPLMVIVGWRARIGGLLVAVNMIMTLIPVHMPQLWTFNSQGGWTLELQGMFLFGALAIMFLGSGRMAAQPDQIQPQRRQPLVQEGA